MKVFILATCRNPDLLPYSLLVFKTIRVGFPTFPVTVHLNGNLAGMHADLSTWSLPNTTVEKIEPTIHHEWITKLLETEVEPFWILDTDIIFYRSFEKFDFGNEPLAGCRSPEWQDDFSSCITRARLHTSLLRFNPEEIKNRLEKFVSPVPDTPFTPMANLINPLIVPFKGRRYFYDTTSLLYHAVGGKSFEVEHKLNYFHFHWGTLSDVVLPRLKNSAEMLKRRQDIVDNPSLGYGLFREADDYYAQRQPQL